MKKFIHHLGWFLALPFHLMKKLIKGAWVVEGRELKEVYIYRLILMVVIWLITFATLWVLDQKDMPVLEVKAQVTDKQVRKVQHYRTQKSGNSSIQVPSHVTYHYELNMRLDIPMEITYRWMEVSRSYYKTTRVGQMKIVRYKRGRWKKPFGNFKWLNWMFGFTGKLKIYPKTIVD